MGNGYGTSLAELLHRVVPEAQISKLAGVGNQNTGSPSPQVAGTTPSVGGTSAYLAHAEFLEKHASVVEDIIAELKALPKVAGLSSSAPAIPRDLAEFTQAPLSDEQAAVQAAVNRALGRG